MRDAKTGPLTTWSREFPAVPAQVREARRLLATILDGRTNGDDALLCLSELVTNSIVHSNSRQPGGEITVRVQLHGPQLRVEVTDQGGHWTARPLDPAGLHGRGLVILSRLADAWGRTGNPTVGWTIWFEMTSAPMAAVPQSPERGDQRWMAVLDGHTLRQLRRKNGLSQEQLAAKAGLSPDTVARLERKSQSRCRSRTLVRLAAAVGEAPGALAAETAGVITAFEAAELVFSPDGGFRYGGGRDLSRLEEQARASDHDIRETAVDT